MKRFLSISLLSSKIIPITNQHTDSHPCIKPGCCRCDKLEQPLMPIRCDGKQELRFRSGLVSPRLIETSHPKETETTLEYFYGKNIILQLVDFAPKRGR